MKRLILLRHAKSDWSVGVEDHARPLNKRGVRSARAVGDWLKQKGFVPDEAMVSDAVRTRQTFEELRLQGLQPRLRSDLYHADIATMLDALRSATGDCVVMVGHNPGTASFADKMHDGTLPDPDLYRYPTAATLVMDFGISNWHEVTVGTGQTVDFVLARALIA